VDEQTLVVKVRRRRSREETEQLVAEYEASGLRQVEFCRKQGLSLATLARYRKRQTQGSPAVGNRWVEVKESAGRPMQEDGARSGLAVALRSGRRIEVGRGFDAHTLTQLLDVLERL
jgi:transposase-like protein